MSRSPERYASPDHASPGATIDEELKRVEFNLLLEHYEPTYLGSGGEQIVFTIKGHPTIVAKVDRFSVERFVKLNRDEGREPDDLPDGIRAKAKESMKREFESLKILRDYFGDAVLREKRFLQKIPVTKQLLLEASEHPDWFDHLSEGEHELWAVVRVQERLPKEALDPHTSVGLAFDYLEKYPRRFDAQTVKRWTVDLVDGAGETAREYLSRALPDYPHFLAEYDRDAIFREQVRAFAEAAIAYTNETSEILDLAGTDNAVLFRSGDQWKLLLPDARYPSRHLWDNAVDAVEEILRGRPLGMTDANRLLNALNYTRFINALSALSGSRERLRLSRNQIAPKYDEMARELANSFRSS